MEILSIVLSIIALIVSAIGVTASIITAKLQYRRSINVDLESDSANFAIVNGKERMLPSFTYMITNTSNLPIFIKEIGFMGYLDDSKKPEMVEISQYEPSDDRHLVKLEAQNSINYFISMKDMSSLIKNCILKHNVKNFVTCVKCSNGKIYKHNFGDAKKFYKSYFYQFETMPEYY